MSDIPNWKVWLSYLSEIHIESAPSEWNPHLYVSMKRGRLQLSTARAVYSFSDLYSNFRRSFKQTNFAALPGQEVLLLGLGLGSVPYMLETVFGRQFRYTAVEIDDSVIYLANKYVLQQLESPIEIIETNAYTYVEQCDRQFDLIIMDVFLDDIIPASFQKMDYLQSLKRLLRPGGALYYNRLAQTREDKKLSMDFYKQKFQPVFPNAVCLDVQGNYMLISDEAVLED
ncbi:MAG: methyltransferase domain-containing protein [Phaeodactylibacter sp.]|nr:methyltransferase domain-containing protein [Phaeodactylibacter sp.]